MPLNLLLGETNYLDKLTVENQKVLQFVEQSETLPTSSQPDYKTVENLYSFLSSYYKEVIVITVAKALSGTFNVFTKVAEDMHHKIPGIRVVDSKLNSGAQGLIVMRCAEYIQQGLLLNEIVDRIQQDIEHARIWVNVKSISNMIKAGRLSKNSGKLAKLLGLKPIVSLDATGKGILDGIAFNFRGSMKKSLRKIAMIRKQKKILYYAVVHVNNRDDANQIAADLESLLHQKPVFIEDVSSITSVSAGDGAIAVSMITE